MSLQNCAQKTPTDLFVDERITKIILRGILRKKFEHRKDRIKFDFRKINVFAVVRFLKT